MRERDVENKFKQLIPYFGRFQTAVLDAIRKEQPGSYRIGFRLKADGGIDVELHLSEQSSVDFRYPDPDIPPDPSTKAS
jgi:hypothetical protein